MLHARIRHLLAMAVLGLGGLASAVAMAAPMQLAAQGRLISTSGGPVSDGSYPMALSIYDQATGGTALYKELFLGINVNGGVFAVALGAADTKLDSSLFADGKALWIGVQVGVEAELPRQPLQRVPYAAHAWTAAQSLDLQCSGCVTSAAIAKAAITGDKIANFAIGANHVNFPWAASDQPGGAASFAIGANTAKLAEQAKLAENAGFADDATHALSADKAKAADTAGAADTAKTADVAKGLQCTGCVGTDQLADASVTKAKLAAGAVSTEQIVNGAVTGDKIANGTITGDKIADGTITAAKLAKGAGLLPTSALLISPSPYDQSLLDAGYKRYGYSIDLKGERNWIAHKNLPTGRLHPTVAVVKNRAYVIGGGGPAHFDGGSKLNEMYDPDTDTWTTKAPMPTARGWNPWVVLNDVIYVAGGVNAQVASAAFESYDPATDKWTALTPMPVASIASWGIAYGGKAYFFAGSSGATQIYDPVTAKWSTGAAVPGGGGEDHATAELDGKLYVIGGAYSPDRVALRRYDPATNTWESLANMPDGVTDGFAYVVGRSIYVWCGWDSKERDLRVYDVDSQTWSSRTTFLPPIPNSAGYNRFKIAMLNGRAYFMGGAVSSNEGVAYNQNVVSFGPIEAYLYSK